MAIEEPKKTASQLTREKALELASADEAVLMRAEMEAAKNSTWGGNLSGEKLHQLARVARELDLSIGAAEILMLGGNPYVTLSGRLRKAHESGKFQGFFDESPLPRDEWPDYGVPEDAVCAYKGKLKKDGIEHPFIEVGWAGGKREANQPVARAFPGEMGRKRLRSRLLSLAFPIGLPSVEEIGIEIPDDIFNKAVLAGAIDATGPIKAPQRASAPKPAPAPSQPPPAPPKALNVAAWREMCAPFINNTKELDAFALQKCGVPVEKLTRTEAAAILEHFKERWQKLQQQEVVEQAPAAQEDMLQS